ncbi:MAG: serine hydroxymethyltransferase [Nocardioides sp.]|nr:serine hydroxymethyltransferase [Nocardioides sp.]
MTEQLAGTADAQSGTPGTPGTESGTPQPPGAGTTAALPTDFPSRAPEELSTPLAQLDPEIAGFIDAELGRQREGLEMIASENHTATAVMEAQGSVLTNKYAEGYPGRRYYGGCEFVDEVERLAIARVKDLFGAAFANVQPHSGAQANASVMHALIRPGDTVLGLDLAHGGHLTHGMKLNFSGRLYDIVAYGVDDDTHRVDMAEVARLAREHQPKLIVAGWSAYSRQLDFAEFRRIADEVGAYLMVDMAHFAGLVAGKVFTGNEDPVPHAHVVTTTTHKSLRGPRGGMVLATEEYAPSVDRGCPMVLGGPLSHVMAAKAVAFAEARQDGFRTYAQQVADNAQSLAQGFLSRGADLVTGGTDNHLVLLDVSKFGLTGRQAESALLDAGVVTNRNSVPNDPNGAWYTSGIRLGTPALTTRGFGHDEFDAVADLIVTVLQNTEPGTTKAGGPSKASYSLGDGVADKVRAASAEMLDKHPLYPGLDLA